MSLRRTPFPAFSRCPFACLFPSLSPLSLSFCVSVYLECFLGLARTTSWQWAAFYVCILALAHSVSPGTHTYTPPPAPPSADAAATALFCQTFPFVCRLSNVRCILLGALLQPGFFSQLHLHGKAKTETEIETAKLRTPTSNSVMYVMHIDSHRRAQTYTG